MVVAEAVRPYRKLVAQGCKDRRTTLEFHAMSLTIIETDGLNVRKPLERPGKADGRILPAREEDKCRLVLL